ncbi:MAG: hypothetical protein HGA67_01385 [Candidatus Yonathbacteria bacterium]|nr:hypothetical protein [Candidatus Yonathbacteria bacterium]
MISQLKKLGFSENEARVYLAALELGETSVQRIAKKARLKRTTIYSIIDILKERGLIKTTKNRKKVLYIAEDPRKLKESVSETVRIAEDLLPSLLAITNVIDQKPRVLYFEGIEGMKEIYKETLSYHDSQIYGWLSSGAFDVAEPWFDDFYRQKRIEKKIYTKVIIPDTEKTRAYHEHDAQDFHRTKIDMSGGLSIASDILLFGNRHVAILSWEEMSGIIIESTKIYSTLSSIFSVHWNSLQ